MYEEKGCRKPFNLIIICIYTLPVSFYSSSNAAHSSCFHFLAFTIHLCIWRELSFTNISGQSVEQLNELTITIHVNNTLSSFLLNPIWPRFLRFYWDLLPSWLHRSLMKVIGACNQKLLSSFVAIFSLLYIPLSMGSHPRWF